MKKYTALVVTLLLVAAHVRAQVSGIAGYLLVGRSTVAAMPAAASVTRGLWIVTDDADCDASTADDGVTVCVDEGATWAALAGGGGGGAPDPHATTHQDGGSDEIDVTGLLGLLGTAQTPAAHTQASTTISDSTAAGRTLLTAADAPAQRTALALGTSAVLNVPAAGNAAVGEVVKGDDSRLTDARTPTSTLAHASSHQHSGTDEVATATPGANAIPKAGAGGTIAAGWVPTLNQSTTGNAATATALAADPADCGVNQFGTAIAASGDLTCAAIADADIPDTITASNYAPLAGATFSGPVAIDNAQTFKLFEADANGSNFFALVAPASFTGDVTCTLGADGKIPDSCVGDGTDGGGASSSGTGLQKGDGAGGLADTGIASTNGGVAIVNTLASAVPLSVTGVVSQSANILNVTTSGGGAGNLFKIASDGALSFGYNGTLYWTTYGDQLKAITAGPTMRAVAPNATTPTLLPNQATTSTGLGSENVNDARLIATNVARVVASSTTNAQSVWITSGIFVADGDARERIWVVRNSTTTATPAELFTNGSSERMVLPNDTTWAFSCLVTARRTDADGEGAGYKLEGVIDRQTNAASTALIGAVTTTTLAEDNAAWDVAATADTTNGALIITVTGEASKTIRWVASCRTAETTG